MTLFEQIKEITNDDFFIAFGKDINQLVIRINYSKENTGKLKIYERQSLLPLHDHFYEAKVVDCITWMVDEIKNEINTPA